MNDRHASGLQLEPIYKKVPVLQPKCCKEEGTVDVDQLDKRKALACQIGVSAALNKSKLKADSAGMANPTKLSPSKTKIGGSASSSKEGEGQRFTVSSGIALPVLM